MNKKQRIYFAIVDSFVGLIEFIIIFLLLGLNVRSGAPAILTTLLAFLPLAAGIYFLSFKIWDKKKQEEREDQEPENSFTKKQRILLALVITSVVPVELLVIHGLGYLMGVIITLLSLITGTIITAAGVYFLSFKIRDNKHSYRTILNINYI